MILEKSASKEADFLYIFKEECSQGGPMLCIRKKQLFFFMAIVVMFFAACDDASSSPAETADVFTMTEEYSYFVAYDAENGECGFGLSISKIRFDFGPGNNVKVSIKDARGTLNLSGLYRKEIDDDNEIIYIMQLNISNKVTNWIYSPGSDGGFGIVTEDELSVYVHDKKNKDKLLEECPVR